jgi:hypothetical protein
MVMILERRGVAKTSVTTPFRPAYESDDGPGVALMASLLSRSPATFTVETGDTGSVRAVTEFASPLRLFLLMAGMVSGGVSATVAPHFSEETYPALLDLVGRLNGSGASELWRPDGARTLAVGEARHVFISADMPVVERSVRPDRLLEVVAAHRITADWYLSRVAPRVVDGSMVRVFYGRRGVAGSAFAAADAEAMVEEAMTGGRRRFSLPEHAATRQDAGE